MQCKEYSDKHLFADLDGLDDVHQIAKFTLRGAADAAPALAAFAMRGASVQAGGRSVGAVLENDILKSGNGGDIRFAIQVTSRFDWRLLSKSVVHGAKIAAHSMRDGGVHIDGITLQDMAPLNLGDTHKSNEGETTLMKSSGTFGTKHVMKLGRGGGAGGGLSTAEFLDLVKGFRKASSSNIEHLGHALDPLGKVGGHLTAAKARYPFDNNVRGAVASHSDAMECLKKINLPAGEADAPELPQGSGKPEPADSGARASTPRFLGPSGSWDGVTTGARPDLRVTETEPGRKAASIGPDAFVKAFGEHRASSRRSVTFRR